MQNRRENRDDESMHFEGFGAQSSMMSSFFGGKDPFDDPFFTRPFGSMSGSMFDINGPFSDSAQVSGSKGPVIEELNSSDEGEDEEGDGKSAKDENFVAEKNARSEKGPIVEHPDNSDNEKQSRDDLNRVRGKQPQTRSVTYRKVSYGGIDGTYYTATSTRKTGSDGVMVEESKQADSTTGQASHRISRGVHDKGHSVTRKLNPDGKVDTVQTLHNLEEDELTGFEEAWKGNAEVNLPGWSDGSNLLRDAGAGDSGLTIGSHDWGVPFGDRTGEGVGTRPNNEDSNRGRTRKVVRINID